jgi:hypothetical protein
MDLTPTVCLLHALQISYHLCFLPRGLHAFDTHIMRAICLTNILSSMLPAKMLYAFDTPLCVLHALLIFYDLRFLPNFYMHSTPILFVLYVLLISYLICFLAKTILALDTNTMRATCPTNSRSLMLSAKNVTCI